MSIYFYNFIYGIYSNKWIVSIKRGLLKVKPLILINCIIQILIYFLSITNFSFLINSEITILNTLLELRDLISYTIYYATITAISFSLVDKHNQDNKEIYIHPIIVSFISLACVLILNIDFDINIDSVIFLIYKSSLSLIFVLLSSQMFISIFKYINKFQRNRLRYYDKIYDNSIRSIAPAALTILITVLIKILIIDKFLKNIIVLSENNNTIFFTLKDVLLNQIIWFLGGNGGEIIYSHRSTPFYVIFSNIGGAGSTLSLIIAVYILKSRRKNNVFSPLLIFTSLFNINEPILYGLPIIFNPIYLIPFILVPVLLTIVTFWAVSIGFITINYTNINWVTPIFINSYVLTNSINGVILQLINLFLGVLVYIPFVNISNKLYDIEINRNFESLKNFVFSDKINESNLIPRDDSIGRIAKTLSIDLYNDLINEKGLYLVYQPQVNKKGKVIGVESLLRWNHDILGNIPPNIAVKLAEESNFINDLGKWIIKKSCKELNNINNQLDNKIELSINISPLQLTDSSFYDFIKTTIEDNNLDFNDVKLEIIETSALGNDKTTTYQIKQLNKLGIKFAIDDFGEGYNPILYIKKYDIDTIKIDGSLIKDIEISKDSLSIVDAMYKLCENSGIKIVCEFVESKGQKEILDSLGDGFYQGYLFSKPLSPEECLVYIKNNI